MAESPFNIYFELREMLQDKEHDEIMAHIEYTGITVDDSTDLCNELLTEKYSTVVGQRNTHVFDPLMLAVKHGRFDIMNSLIMKGFDPRAVHHGYENDPRYSLIHYASGIGSTGAIATLVEEHHVDVNIVDALGYTPMMTAIRYLPSDDTTLQTVKCLVEKGADVTHTADLTAAVCRGLLEASKYLITCGGNLHQTQPYEKSPLMYVVEKSPLMSAVKDEENIEMIKLLVEAGASVEGPEGRKLLYHAVDMNDAEMVEYCCSIGIDPDWEVYPAVNFATFHDSYEVARYLVVDVNVSLQRRGANKLTAFETAFRWSEAYFIELFIKAGYNPCKESCLNEDSKDEDLQQMVLDSVARRTLQDLCVFQIRKTLGKYANSKVQQLLLPIPLKDIIQLNHIPRTIAE